MADVKYATALEQSVSMYSLADDTVLYWMNWAEKFIECCKTCLGWEVVQGPGTSLGAVMSGTYEYVTYDTDTVYSNERRYQPRESSAWDCDWTQPNGINLKYQGDNSTYQGYPLYTGWFYNLDTWPQGATDEGIDYNIGRFDFIVYTDENNAGEKIGFRIKYPVCSIGYSKEDERISCGNYIWGTPSISLYSNIKGDIENYYPDSLNNNSVYASSDKLRFNYFFPGKGYIRFFGKRIPMAPNNINNYDFWGKTDINDTVQFVSQEQAESALWSLNLQLDENFTKSSVGVYNNSRYVKQNPNKLFKNYWKRFNKFHYQVSSTGETTYLYISNDLDHEVGFKIISTTLENGEKAIFIERQQVEDSGELFEVGAVTGLDNYNQATSNSLIQLPIRPYTKYSSKANRFSFSRMLIPTQLSLCTDLYYVVKRDIDDTIQDGQYVLVRDKNSEKHYFRVIPFGSRYTYEVTGDNTSYLAFPIISPEETNING